ncbi:ATP-binding cassette domain-containing protein [Halosquirtibacter xylanolyticus]|uniref:ATP-binding cassette domain-containing protein n=1 Tax=Halosquirtibacter xylanolyticus TaxID=3374599 RepID=UPI00374A11CA|nr:ATP-binding cassette domain-containing protein [Prolixibacteraceae bacterium]
MIITLDQVKPIYMSEQEISCSDIYMNRHLVFNTEEKVLIKAQSGRGKSSLLNFIYGIKSSFDGEIMVNGHSVRKEVQSNYISYVFQDLKLFEALTVKENILLKNDLTKHKRDAEIEQMLSQLGLSEKRDEPVKHLSIGQQQRVAIIRALCQPFQFLFLDEPFSHLDQHNVKVAVDLINRELTSQKAGLLLTTLDPCDAFEYDKTLQL